MANSLKPQDSKLVLKDISFLDWNGLSDDEFQRLNKIINGDASCAAVKLPFNADKRKQGCPPSSEVCNQTKFEENESLVHPEPKCGSTTEPVYQSNIPPPPSQQPVVAYTIPVHHWAQGPPPQPGAPPPHFPITMPGGYVFPSQPPPPPLVSNGDAATIAFVAAMTGSQPVYAIPGVPMQSVHGHYQGAGGYAQTEPIDLSVPPAPQQLVTISNFVQPDGMIFSHAPVVIPATQAMHPVPVNGQGSQNVTFASFNNQPDPHVPHQQYNSNNTYPDSHIVYMPHDYEATVENSFKSKSDFPQAEGRSTSSISIKPSKLETNQKPSNISASSAQSSGVQFVGPVVFPSEESNSTGPQNDLKNNNKLTIEKITDSVTPCVTDDAKISVHEAQELKPDGKLLSPDLPNQNVQLNSTSKLSEANKVPVPQSVSDKAAPDENTDFVNKKQSTPSPNAVAPSQPPAPTKMWSSLFGKPKQTSSPVAATQSNPESSSTNPLSTTAIPSEGVKSVRYWQEKEEAEAKHSNSQPSQKIIQSVGTSSDPLAPKILEILSKLPVVHTPIVIQPRGLVNGSNVCFMNATLQVLMGCPPFIHLFRAFKNLPSRQGGGSCTPIFDSLINFVNSFQNGQRVKSQGSRNKKMGTPSAYLDVNVGQPFSPSSLLSVAQDILGLRIGIQHDAEEFLSKILMICHEELERVMKLNQPTVTNNNNEKTPSNGFVESPVTLEGDEDDDDSWQQVGPKNHYVETNVNDCGQTPLSSIFSGLSRSCLTRETGKNSDTLDSFFSLKLDIQGENVHNVIDALQRLNVLETLHDMDGGKMQGQRRMFFDILPPVLILHLKLFQYSDGTGKKIQKQIDFDVDLTIPKETLSRVGKQKYMSQKSRSYKLFGVVNHHGLKMTDGHYTSDVFLPIASGWLRFDDSEVFAIHEKQVLQYSDSRMPYLLFYRRMDVS